MGNQEDGRLGCADRATHEPNPQGVSAVPVGIADAGKPQWSFDDEHIGLRGDVALLSRSIRRPPSVGNAEWYSHAGAVVRLMNGGVHHG